MKVTQAMIEAFGTSEIPDGRLVLDRREVEAGIQAVLDLIMPDTLETQRVYVDGDVVTVIDQRERPRLAYGLTRGEQYRISVDAHPIPAERAK